jgi:hypothetical protein
MEIAMDSRTTPDLNLAATNLEKTTVMQDTSGELNSGGTSFAASARALRIKVTPFKMLRAEILAAQTKCKEDNNPETLNAYSEAVARGYEHFKSKSSSRLKYHVIDPNKETPLTFLESQEEELKKLKRFTRKTTNFRTSLNDNEPPDTDEKKEAVTTSAESRPLTQTMAEDAAEDNTEVLGRQYTVKRNWLQFFKCGCCCVPEAQSSPEQANSSAYSAFP